jgi:single-strand DNA-binding protein
MASVNKVILVGNCGRDPEMRQLPSGQSVATTSIATSSRRKDKNTGELIESTEWHRVVFFDQLAKIAGDYLKKGNPVYVEGRLKYGTYVDKTTGVEKNTTDIIVTEMQLLGARQSTVAAAVAMPSAPPATYAPASAPQRTSASVAAKNTFDDMDDDIPF